MSKPNPIWNRDDLARERVRAVFVIAVVGVVAAARYFKIFESFSMKFELLDWANVFDILIAFWVAYLVLMVFAISDDVFGTVLGAYGRAMSYGAKIAAQLAFFVGPFFTLGVAIWVGFLKDPFRTTTYVALLVFVLYLLRKPIRKQFGSPSGETSESTRKENGVGYGEKGESGFT